MCSRIATRVKRRGGDHGVIGGQAVALGERQPCFMHLHGERMNRQHRTERVQKGVRLGSGHLHLPARDVGNLVENLHADGAAASHGGFGSVDLRCIA